MADIVHRAAGVVLPQHVAAAVDTMRPGPVGLRVALVVALLWGSMRLVRALRTGVRATCGQPAGSGNPFRDGLRDAVLGIGLLAAMAVATLVTALAATGDWWGVLVSIPVVGTLIAAATVRCAWRGTGRPQWSAALRAGTAAAALLHLLTVAAGPYFAAMADLHATLYRSAGAIVGVLVWCNVACRILFRATSWASTTSFEVWAAEQAAPGREAPKSFVVVPAYNEASSIPGCLEALASQSTVDFTLVVVDNGSTDTTAEIVAKFAVTAPMPVVLLSEERRGPGAAADTGFRYAIEHGAGYLARTDADCVPAPDWVATVRAVLDSGAEMACGRSVPRPDENPSWAERRVFPAAVRLAALYGRWRPEHRGPEYRAPYVLCHGHNLALTADLYERCGGASDTPLEAGSEDVELLNRARRHSSRVVRAENMVVYNSLRRLRAWGPRRTLLWYWDRRYRPAAEADVHVREPA
jgi:GT2 family glycosyltransferase